MSNESTEMTSTRFEAIVDYLEGEQVPYELVEHEETMSAAAEARAAHVPAAEVGKTVVLHDGGGYVIVAIPASRRLDLHKLRDLIGASRRLQLSGEDEIARSFPTMEVGAIPPFGPVVPALEVIDRELADLDRVLWPAGDHRHSVMVAPRDVVRITEARVADICED